MEWKTSGIVGGNISTDVYIRRHLTAKKDCQHVECYHFSYLSTLDFSYWINQLEYANTATKLLITNNLALSVCTSTVCMSYSVLPCVLRVEGIETKAINSIKII